MFLLKCVSGLCLIVILSLTLYCIHIPWKSIGNRSREFKRCRGSRKEGQGLVHAEQLRRDMSI